MPDGRVKEYYKSFRVIAAFYEGQFQAKASHKFTDNLKVKKCTSIQDAVEKIKSSIDSVIDKNLPEIKEKIIKLHKSNLLELNIKYQGVREVNPYRRIDHCYKCKRPVDNLCDLECVSCSWIICSGCASCGCGFTGNISYKKH
ncbi:MAG: hypothetical protein COB26_11960 [Piscirickettsiaceae bacterium]|nr:MAG: hypothetical protein COB26_11960 [Piscirickettsiaceae bacterium]